MDPLVPPNVDLRDFAFMPLDVMRLRDSDLASRTTGEEFRAAVLLWCASWHQVPAASLPDDDIVLSALAGFGRVVKEWKVVRAGALHGWNKCSDGRLYHSVVAEKANEAWLQKMTYAWRKECDRVRKENAARQKAGLIPLEFPKNPAENRPSSAGIPAENALNRQGTDLDQNLKTNLPPPSSTILPAEGRGGGKFDKFWKGFPDTEGRSEDVCRAEFEGLSSEDQDAAIASLPKFTARTRAKPPSHPLAPEKFLRERRFATLQPSSKGAADEVFVLVGSPGWHAWTPVRPPSAAGKLLTTVFQGKEGWWFPSEFPSDIQSAFGIARSA